jgi:lipid-A-disaccharide synthase-like uncharacterized protein
MQTPRKSRLIRILAGALVLAGVGVGCVAATSPGWTQWFTDLLKEHEIARQLHDPWVWFGFGAQALFFMRFVWQWIVSEKRGRSTVPVAFWYFSLTGGLSLFFYAWHNHDLVIMSGQLLACGIYVRNLMLIHRTAARRRARGLPQGKLRSAVNGENDDDSAT